MRFLKGLILIMVLSTVSCQESEKSAESPRKVKCEGAVESNEGIYCSSFPGRVVAATDLNLGFRVAGIIEEICASDGTFVRQGEVIARLDKRDYTLQLAATQAEYDAIKAEVDRVVALYADQSISANDYDKATNGLRAITAKLEAHKNALADTQLRAPISGYISKSNFGKGEAVAAGTPVISIISAAAPEITIDIPALYYLKQDHFESASAKVELLGDINFDLKLKSISPKANLNQLYKATFVVEAMQETLPSVGMSAMVEMRYTDNQQAGVTIPFSAVVESEGKNSVWVIANGAVESRKVIINEITSGGRVLVNEGLSAGEVVVTAGVSSLKEGQRVEPLKEASASNVGGIK